MEITFKHESEIIQPGYHRLYLDRYKTWVEYTATERATFYRLNYTENVNAKLLVDVGSVLGIALWIKLPYCVSAIHVL